MKRALSDNDSPRFAQATNNGCVPLRDVIIKKTGAIGCTQAGGI
jgi:hypothetical protein